MKWQYCIFFLLTLLIAKKNVLSVSFVCMWVSAYKIGLNRILVGWCSTLLFYTIFFLFLFALTLRNVLRTLEISIYFYIHVCMLFLLISSVWLNWKSTLSLYAHHECDVCMCVYFSFFFSLASLVSAYAIHICIFDGCFHSNLSFSQQWLLLYCYDLILEYIIMQRDQIA